MSYIGGSERKRDAQWLSMKLHIGYIRSLEDSERVHEVCVKFLQNWMVFFYPERLDLFGQAEEMAKSLGGQLKPPRLSWKYSWIKALFGWRLARHAQWSLPKLRWSLVRFWDKALYRTEGPRHAADLRI